MHRNKAVSVSHLLSIESMQKACRRAGPEYLPGAKTFHLAVAFFAGPDGRTQAQGHFVAANDRRKQILARGVDLFGNCKSCRNHRRAWVTKKHVGVIKGEHASVIGVSVGRIAGMEPQRCAEYRAITTGVGRREVGYQLHRAPRSAPRNHAADQIQDKELCFVTDMLRKCIIGQISDLRGNVLS
ncbi:hypothetical protein O3W52_24285 [Ensifer psoraleae]|uniref:Uncharacterized protein n=1 Tax=Sinorhizobium psoraleae TaxID=520838 RepID=A0ABT4KM71_9HYPH|nr:hypothetical protein [Sinorhizobium psoraleae]MCZ4093064.1 hypothetical protein [Sinorhizobium psoraleae]